MDNLQNLMFTLLLLVSKMQMLVAQLHTTDQTVTISKNLTDPVNITDTYCGELCNVRCHLQNQSLDVFPACLPRTIGELDLSFNNITEIGDQDVVEYSSLAILNLSHNQIKKIHWEIHILAELELLDLSSNLLSVVPKCLMLKRLSWLSLDKNPITHIHAFAFSSFPNLVSLSLSFTLLGNNSSEDIHESAFALNTTQAQEDSLKSLQSLDLSGTYIRRVNHSWSKDLPNLKMLQIRKMINMEVLEDELIKWFPHLEYLTCADSRRLHYIRTEIFNDASNLMYLDFQNCNLKSLSPWNISSAFITIDLHGNPLMCDCELDSLFSHNSNISLARPNETFCSLSKGDVPKISMTYLHKACQLPQSNPKTEIQDSVTSSTAAMISDFIAGTTEDSLSSTLPLDTTEPKYSLAETTMNFTTRVFENDSTTSSSITQSGLVTTETVSTSGEDFSPKELTLFLSTTNEPVTEHKFPESGSSNGDQQEILKDYLEEYDDETQPNITTEGSRIAVCDYDHCRHLQTPCSELQLLKPCLCPGLSGDDTVPDPPHLQGVYEISDTSAQILWCSPNSVVQKYQLVYHPESGAHETVDNIYVTMRQYTLYNLAPYTTYKVCVLAFNKKGHSIPNNGASRTPCAEFRTRPSYILILSILSVLGGLFLVTIAVLSTCLYKACKSNSVSKYDTHLVSYKNPAFEYHCTIPSYH